VRWRQWRKWKARGKSENEKRMCGEDKIHSNLGLWLGDQTSVCWWHTKSLISPRHADLVMEMRHLCLFVIRKRRTLKGLFHSEKHLWLHDKQKVFTTSWHMFPCPDSVAMSRPDRKDHLGESNTPTFAHPPALLPLDYRTRETTFRLSPPTSLPM